jgi:CRISPR-associated endonuclease Cas1
MLEQKLTSPYPPLQVRAGVLVADGFGIKLRVLHGKLCIEDGIGRHRRSIVLERAGSKLERLVLIGKTGSITLESLAWLRAVGAAFLQIGSVGALLAHTIPFGYDGLPIRRAQALAETNGLDVILARSLIAQKLVGQRKNLTRLRVSNLAKFDELRESLNTADTIEKVRGVEANAAALYWNAWSGLTVRWRDRDLTRVPENWMRYSSRASLLTGAPRAATNPVNSCINYLQACLAAETRLALLAHGLDTSLGVLHADHRNRESFVLDAMEPIRPEVEAFVLDLFDRRTFTSRDFAELPNGVCRLCASLSHELALTLPHWRTLVRPVVASLAQAFRDALSNPDAPHRARTGRGARDGRAGLATIQSPLVATPRKTSQPRPYASRAWSASRPEAPPSKPTACESCGKPVLKRRRRHCEACMPKARREHGLRAVEAARRALAAQTAAGNDPRTSAAINRVRGEAIAEGHRRNRRWAREHPRQRDEAWFKREVVPKLDGFSLKEIGKATGLSLAACSRIRAGAKVPHPRHWDVLETLVQGLLKR